MSENYPPIELVRKFLESKRNEIEQNLQDLKTDLHWMKADGMPVTFIDVRLQVLAKPVKKLGWKFDYRIWSGDPSFDTDHRGFWGTTSVMEFSEIPDLADDMINETLDSVAMHG